MAKKYTAQCACGAVKFEFDKDPDLILPKLEMFVKRRLNWEKALDMPQFDDMPG